MDRFEWGLTADRAQISKQDTPPKNAKKIDQRGAMMTFLEARDEQIKGNNHLHQISYS